VKKKSDSRRAERRRPGVEMNLLTEDEGVRRASGNGRRGCSLPFTGILLLAGLLHVLTLRLG